MASQASKGSVGGTLVPTARLIPSLMASTNVVRLVQGSLTDMQRPAQRYSRSLCILPRASSSEPHNAPTTTNTSKDDMLARIARAKQYKSGGGAAASAPAGGSSAPSAPTQPATPTQPGGAADWGAMVGFLERPVESERSSSGSAGSAGLMNASPSRSSVPLAPKLDSVFGSGRSSSSGSGFAVSDDGSGSPISSLPETDKDLSVLPDRFRAPVENVASLLAASQEGNSASWRGSATQAADSLRAVLSDGASSSSEQYSNMSMEQYTEAKEERQRAQGADIQVSSATVTSARNLKPDDDTLSYLALGSEAITAGFTANVPTQEQQQASQKRKQEARDLLQQQQQVEAGTRPQQAQGQQTGQATDAYSPTVSTWGVFPRPADISKAYGGGRDIKPGQELETAEQRATREASYADALKAYRTKAGLDVDPEAESAAMALYEEGMAFFNDGELRSAYDKFDAATKKVGVKTKPGGLATLQKAIVLDSLGYSDDAQKLYKTLQGHAVAIVARKAKQMLFGFEAAKFLKADTISYSVKKNDYLKYFRAGADRNTIYVPTPEEKERDTRNAAIATALAVAIILGPITLVGGLALTR